jgi:aspartate carbamoyltransferase catalytic subunit
MRDTVELLEAIGRDATLRRASPEVLARTLAATQASLGLLELVTHGDGSKLKSELALVDRYVEHMTQTGAFDDEDLLLS